MYRETAAGFIRDNWDSRRALIFQVAGRVKPGVTVDAAQANLSPIAASLAEAYPRDNTAAT